MKNNKLLLLNVFCSIASFGTNLMINFILSPYIVRTIGVEANGFISLGNNFITYISLLTIAVSSMTSRFVTVSMQEDNLDKAKKYYSSAFVGNLLVLAFILIPSVLIILNLQQLLDIPKHLVTDVKILFTILIFNFMINNLFANLSLTYFCKDKIYIQNIVTLIGYLLRLISIFILFVKFKPKVYFIAIAFLIVIVYTQFVNLLLKRKIMPEVTFSFKNFNKYYMFELIKSGIWNSITTLGVILLTGLDLLIANIYLGSFEMGILALVKTITNTISTLNNQINQIFYPKNTILFAKNKIEELVIEIKNEINILSVLNAIPVSILLAFGRDFFALWQSSQDSLELYTLCCLTISSYVFLGGADSIWSIFTVTNKLKTNSILIVFSGILNVIIVVILEKFTNLGIYAIAGVSPLIAIIRHLFYTIPISAKYLSKKRTTFLSQVLISFTNVSVLFAIGICLKRLIAISSWSTLFFNSIILAIIGILINILIHFKNIKKRG